MTTTRYIVPIDTMVILAVSLAQASDALVRAARSFTEDDAASLKKYMLKASDNIEKMRIVLEAIVGPADDPPLPN